MRPRRPPYVIGHYYHIYNRGVAREKIFRENENYLFVLRKCKEYCGKLSIAMIAYCLMPNHYHFLVRQESENAAGLLPQRVFNSYTKAFNKRFNRSGTLFEGPYQVVLVEENAHLLHLCRYIHANPVMGNVVENLENWPYSNYLEWVGLRHGSMVNKAFIVEQFDDQEIYSDFMNAYLQNPTPEDEKYKDFNLFK